MKTNHRRGFKANKHRRKGGTSFTGFGVLADMTLYASAVFAGGYGGERRVARSVRGAKKSINARFRHHENAATRRLASDLSDGD